jgi:pimeloyl-ACP methyl ester carboxylesterase
MPSVDLGTRRIFYERRGSGEPLLLIQGMAGHHKIWGEPFLKALARDFDVIVMENRGIGESTDVPGDFTTLDLAEDAIALLDALGLHDAHVLGISLGGMAAQELVLHHPDRVRRLVIGCSYCGGPGASLRAPGPLRMMTAMQTRDVEQALRAAYVSNFSAGFAEDENHYGPFREVALAVAAPVDVIMRQAKAAFAHDTSARLGDISVPTLVIHGEEDDMLEYLNGQLIAKLIPDADFHTFDHTGHLFWWEHPEQSAALIRQHCLDR